MSTGAKANKLAAYSAKDEREKGPTMGSYYNSGTSYSAEDLKELSKNARSLGGGGSGGSGPKPASMPSGGALGGVDVLPKKRRKEEPDATGGVKMKGLPLAQRVTPVKKEESEDEEAGPSLVRGRAGTNRSAADDLKSVLQGASSDADATTAVPSDDQIARLKARREQARKMGVGTGGNLSKEFIPLENSVEEQNNSKSRVVRESMEDEEDMMVCVCVCVGVCVCVYVCV